MRIIANLLVGLVAILHVGFLVLEMFLWTTPFGLRTFNLTPEFAEASKVLAANQGLYNGFLAAGLVWGLFARANGFAIKVFFLLLRDHRRRVRGGNGEDVHSVRAGTSCRRCPDAGAGHAAARTPRRLSRWMAGLRSA